MFVKYHIKHFHLIIRKRKFGFKVKRIRLFLPGNGSMAQAGDDGEHGVEVARLLALPGNLDELLDHAHPPAAVGFAHHLPYCPHHLPVDQLGEERQTRYAISVKRKIFYFL